MAALRFLASLFLLLGVIALVGDVTRATSGEQAFVASSLASYWTEFAPNTLQSAKAGVARTTHPLVWDALMASVLNVPAFLLFGALGLICGVAGRRRKRLDIFVN